MFTKDKRLERCLAQKSDYTTTQRTIQLKIMKLLTFIPDSSPFKLLTNNASIF